MIIDDFDSVRIAITPNKTYAPSIIDPDAVLAATISV